MKRFTQIILIVAAFCAVGYRMLTSDKTPQTAQALVVQAVTPSAVIPTDTPYPTMTPLPTIDYRATDQAYSLQMEQIRSDSIAAQNAHEEEMMKQQVEIAEQQSIQASIGATQTYQPTFVALINAENTLTAGKLTAVSVIATSTAEAPAQMAAMFDVQENAKHAKETHVKENIAYSVAILFLLSLTVLVIKKTFVINAAYLEQIEQERIATEAEREPNPANEKPYIPEEHNGINRRMEQRFAQVLIAMRQMEPDDKAVNLLETFWIERGKRDRFQNRNEFLCVRDDWASEENGILKRLDPTTTNSTFYVAKWDEVELIANGERLQTTSPS